MMQAATKDPFMEFMNTSRIEEENFQRRMPHLVKNKEKNFVQRILNPKLNKGKEASWEDKKTGESGTMTHFMTSMDNKVIPMVVDMGGEKFHKFEDDLFDAKDWKSAGDKAYEYAMETGEFIETDSPQEADWLSKNYKTEEFKRGY